MKHFILLLFVGLFCAAHTFAQGPPAISKAIVDTGYYYVRAGCKSQIIVPLPLYGKKDSVKPVIVRMRRKPAPVQHSPLLTIHGNIMYDLYYQSRVDTPFVEKDIYQHTVQTWLDITVKDRYPLRVAFSTQMGNSSLFRNITGINLQYSNKDLKNMILARAKNWDASKLKQIQELAKLRDKLNGLSDQLSGLKGWLSSPSQLQRLIEERERIYYRIKDTAFRKLDEVTQIGRAGTYDIASIIKSRHVPDSLQQRWLNTAPAIDTSFPVLKAYQQKQHEADSLEKEMSKAEARYWSMQKKYGQKKATLMDVLTHSRNNKELTEGLSELNLPDSVLPKGYRTLLSIRSFGIGRTMVNYSELTAKDISITGVQMEYNPSWYVAFATGAVDYRFRNYVVNEARPKQYLNLLRAGIGMKEGNNIILTWYTGKRQVYNMNTNVVPGEEVSVNNNIMGVSLEGQWRLWKNTYLTGEAAKSSLPYYARQGSHSSAFNSMLNFNSHSNEAYAAKFATILPFTDTRISAMYKLMGSDFQSFSLYTTGSRQTAWNMRVDQPLFRRRLTLTGAIRKNDYVTYLQPANYQSNTVFKSIQATMRIPRWPVITVAYQPSSQLMKLGDGRFMENLFYTLSGNASYFYKYKGVMMSSVLSYSQFYNHKEDSNFVYFNSRNLVANHTIFLSRFTLNGMLSAAVNEEYGLYGAAGDVSWKIKRWLEAGGGLKYNRQTVYHIQQLGYTASMRVQIPYFGELAMMADKGFIPGPNKKLVPNNTGRLTYTRIF
ncbi:hypothetical protein [Chitinophaga vietnamensis]|uniref:hypothetical protein n=1 Tax=Chitinophaga vietnamensis TaxID=2593957 RepID=UPI0011784977|nr:hypothetical protein [Chitinophaga vietnamensis]